ncbi:MAG: DUF5317 domain-containing protein [Anaerolineales bacterium]
MLLLSVIAISVLIGLATGGRIQSLARFRLRHAWIPVGLFVLQKVIVELPIVNATTASLLAPALLAASYGALVLFLLVNLSVPGIKLILIGSVLNLTVMLANGGYMPVTREGLERTGHADRIVVRDEQALVKGSKSIVLEPEGTRLHMLSDIFRVPEPYPFATNFSLGDVVISAGVAMMVLSTMLNEIEADADRTTTRREKGRIERKGELDA